MARVNLKEEVIEGSNFTWGEFASDPWSRSLLSGATSGELFEQNSALIQKQVTQLVEQLVVMKAFFQVSSIRIGTGIRSHQYNLGILGNRTVNSFHTGGAGCDFTLGPRNKDGLEYTNEQLYCGLLYLMKIGAIEPGGIGLYAKKQGIENRVKASNASPHYDYRGSQKFPITLPAWISGPGGDWSKSPGVSQSRVISLFKRNNRTWVKNFATRVPVSGEGGREYTTEESNNIILKEFNERCNGSRATKNKRFIRTISSGEFKGRRERRSSDYKIPEKFLEGPIPGLYIYRLNFGSSTTMLPYLPDCFHLNGVEWGEIAENHLTSARGLQTPEEVIEDTEEGIA